MNEDSIDRTRNNRPPHRGYYISRHLDHPNVVPSRDTYSRLAMRILFIVFVVLTLIAEQCWL